VIAFPRSLRHLAALLILLPAVARAQEPADRRVTTAVWAGLAMPFGMGAAELDPEGIYMAVSLRRGGDRARGFRIDAFANAFEFEADYYGWGTTARREPAGFFNVGLSASYFARFGSNRLRPYVLGGAGLHRRTANTWRNITDPYGHPVEFGEGRSALGLAAGTGIDLPLGRPGGRWAVSMEARLHSTLPAMDGSSFMPIAFGVSF
jgi:hypothetical protein